MAKGITRLIKFVLDRKSAEESTRQMERTFSEAGAKSGQNFYRELKYQFDKVTAELREKLARGIINEAEFKKESEKAAKAFNAGLLKAMDEAEKKGELTNREYIKLTKTLKKVGDDGAKSAGLLSTAFGKVVSLIGGFIAARSIVRWTADVISLGAAGAETASKYETTFGAATKSVDRFIESFGKIAGLSRNQAREFLATTGAMARGMGYSEEAAADFSKEIFRVAADLTSFNNVPIEDTMRAVRSAITGERESLKTLGIVILETDVQQRAMAMSGKHNATQLTQQEKSAATLSLILERMGPAAGDLVRTQDSLANSSRRVGAAWQTFKEELGETLTKSEGGTSILDTLSQSIETLSKWVRANGREIQTWVANVISSAGALAQFLHLTTPARSGAAGEIAGIQRQGGGKDFLTARHQALAKEQAALVKEFDALTAKQEKWGHLQSKAEHEHTENLRTQIEQNDIVLGQLREMISQRPGDEETPAQRAAREAREKAAIKAAEAAAAREKAQKLAEKEAKDAAAALAKEIADLETGHKLRTLTAKDIERAIELYKQLVAVAANDPSLAARNTATEQAARIVDIARPRAGVVNSVESQAGPLIRTPAPDLATNQAHAEEMANPWLKALERIGEEAEATGGLFQQLGEAMAKGGLKGLGVWAMGKVRENVAEAIEQLARAAGALASGNAPSATLHLKSAAEHGAAAAAWRIAAGAAGGGSGSAGSAGSAASLGGPTNTSGGAANSVSTLPPEINVYVDPFDDKNPVHQMNVTRGVIAGFERTGYKVNVIRGRG